MILKCGGHFLMFGSRTEPAESVFTIENEKLARADEVRVTIGREGRLARRGGEMGSGGFGWRQETEGGEKTR